MNNKIQNLLYSCIILILLSFTSCYSTKEFLRDGQIPYDFAKDNLPVFIISAFRPRINKIIQESFEKYYNGPYSFVSDDLSLGDVGFSFYAFVEHYRTITSSGYIGRDRDIQFQLRNLNTNKTYKTFGFGNLKPKAKYYIQALEIVRQKNQQPLK